MAYNYSTYSYDKKRIKDQKNSGYVYSIPFILFWIINNFFHVIFNYRNTILVYFKMQSKLLFELLYHYLKK